MFFLPDRVDVWKCRCWCFHTTVQSHIDGSQLAERKQTSNTGHDAHVGTVLQMLLIWSRHAGHLKNQDMQYNNNVLFFLFFLLNSFGSTVMSEQVFQPEELPGQECISEPRRGTKQYICS